MPPSTAHSQYATMLPYWEKMKDTTSSQQVIHDKGQVYLPILQDMTTDQYNNYKQRASFPLYTKHTLSTFVGMVMRKEVMTENVPPLFLNNVDGSGKSLTKYLNNLVQSYLTYGRSASFVDYGNRPKVLLYPAASIINWRTKIIDDIEKLTLVVLRETTSQPPQNGINPTDATNNNDLFVETEYYQYRVLLLEPVPSITPNLPAFKNQKYIYKQFIYDHDGNLTATNTPTKNHKPLNFIPIEIHGGVTPQYPPLIGIAEQNLAYYRLDADYKHGLHYVALPTPYTTGVDPDDPNKPTCIGPTKLWNLPDGATAGMLEFEGAGLSSIKDAKKEVYENIVVLSSRILAPPSSQNETATAANIRNAGETASLAEIVHSLSEEVSRVLNYAINWTETIPTEGIKVQLNKDFIPIILSGADVASYTASQRKGGMSFYTLFNVLKEGEIQQGDRSLEDELKDINEEQTAYAAREVFLAQQIANTTTPKTTTNSNPNKDPLNTTSDEDITSVSNKQNQDQNNGASFTEN